jgi:hypothetical protein
VPDQNCPLCGAPSVFSGHDYGRRKGFSCQNCTEFIVTVSAEKRLEESIQSWKDQLSEKAKATPVGQVLLIYVPDQHQPDAPNKEVLRAEYQPREK